MTSKPVTDPVSKLPPALRSNLDLNLCTCMDVPKRVIIDAIANGAQSVEEVRKQTFATMGSKCCVQQVERLIECIHKPERRRGRRKKAESDFPSSKTE